MKQFLPAIPLAGTKIVVVGTGEAALNKLRLFRTAPCDLVWATLGEPVTPPADLKPDTLILTGRSALGLFSRARLVFIGLDDARRAKRLAGAARRAGALVNVVDNLPLCDFFTPALVDRGTVTIAMSTGGAGPVLARDIRSAVESVISPGVGLLAEAAASARDLVKTRLPAVDARRRFWERALRGEAARLADQGDGAGAQTAILKELTLSKDEARGVVHLVGAGPGDPELLTVKAARLIRDAEVIVHDRLVSPEIIDRARRDAIRIDVGKSAGDHPVPQSRINQILIEEARKGRRVVRLKGGDSFIFGRGGEEVDAVRRAGIEVQVTPGVSAALAAGSQAQIPLTHRDSAQAVTFVTGRPKTDGPALDYEALAASTHTLVVYMGVAVSAVLSRRLIAAGRSSLTPVAVIENASLPHERRVFTTLGTLSAAISEQEITGPAAIVIGDVVAHAPEAATALAARAELEVAA
jgi:uroporphyrin-III C-methyltransferase/precorrin-2 dehydrogenase/sirohydrochlorin ferrochelatase